MKRLFALVLAALLLVSASALAEYQFGTEVKVVKCNEWITLREEPSTSAYSLDRLPLGSTAVALSDDGDSDFVYVHYNGQNGYVLRKYLEQAESTGRQVEPTDEQRYNINLFLTSFTEASFTWSEGPFELDVSSDLMLVDFAIEHIWFNQPDKLEWDEYGTEGNNVRLSDEYIGDVAQKYFGRAPKDLSLTRMDYHDGYYYWQETGGHTNNGFACLDHVEKLGGGRYSVYFIIFGADEQWNNDVCHYTVSEAANYYNRCSAGHAVINVGNRGSLNDRSTWILQNYTWYRN